MATTLGDVAITVRLDLSQARKDADSAPGGGGEGAPHLPGATPRTDQPGGEKGSEEDPEGGASRGRGGRKSRVRRLDEGDDFLGPRIAFGALGTLAASAPEGQLYEQSLALVGSIPIPGFSAGTKTLEFGRKYGPFAGAFAKAFAKQLPDGNGYEAIQKILGEMVATAVDEATGQMNDKLNDLKAFLDPLGTTTEQLTSAVRGLAALNMDVDPEALGEFGKNLYDVNSVITRVALTRHGRDMRRAGRAVEGFLSRLPGGGPR